MNKKTFRLLRFLRFSDTFTVMKEASFTKKRLGDLLCSAGLITETDLQMAIEEQKRTGKRMGITLIELKLVTEFDIANTLANQLGIQYVSLETTPIEPEAIEIVPENLARKYLCVPMNVDKRQLSVAMVDPLDYECIKDIGFNTNLEVKPLISTRKEILKAIEQHYHLDDSVENIVEETADAFKDSYLEIVPVISQAEMAPSEDLRDKSQMAPIIRLFNLILLKAMKARASDIHIDSQRNKVSVRFRIDGILKEEMSLPKWVQGAVISRIKILACLDISERRLPQDGAIRVRLDNHDIDLRIATLPTQYGEKVVIRILDQSATPVNLETLGLSDKDYQLLVQFAQKRQGILLVTGPTGSGKTSTLYSFINQIRSEEINIMTVEDPIEYNIEGLNQIQVKPDIGLTFANCLRSILRQDPNVVLVGEIRDLETAEIAFRAAMTGHFVISTIHTNDAISTIVRLLDMGIPRYIISSSLVGIVAQRLVRKICSKCKEAVPVSEEGVRRLSKQAVRSALPESYRGKGCGHCNFTGFRGRTGIFEILPFGSKIKDIIASGGTEEEIRLAVEGQGITAMGEDGLAKVKAGITTLEEVLRVIEVEEEIRVLCPGCEKAIHLDFVVCPHCRYEIRSNCSDCKRHLQSEWLICPYCKKER
ncbi:MAG: type II secretion system protein GspE [Candidatus Manganitrophaceae bacterium]|nr:MAG: type II secretion system protein GspE [Candidatus Manganitrophaceae bacterium]